MGAQHRGLGQLVAGQQDLPPHLPLIPVQPRQRGGKRLGISAQARGAEVGKMRSAATSGIATTYAPMRNRFTVIAVIPPGPIQRA